jgi:hypothetical protein
VYACAGLTFQQANSNCYKEIIQLGTRADFYIGKGKEAEWLGSIAWDGYPDGIDDDVLSATSEESYREAVTKFLTSRDDRTLPEQGWPWPWTNSRTTDYSYWFFDNKVSTSCFGHALYDPLAPKPEFDEEDLRFEVEKKLECPEFSKDQMAPAGTRRSGVMVFGI